MEHAQQIEQAFTTHADEDGDMSFTQTFGSAIATKPSCAS